MKKLTDAHNIGKVLEMKLQSIGIDSLEKLKEAGTETAFSKVKEIDHNASRSTLFAIEGAITSVKWHELNEARKEELRDFFNQVEAEMN